MNMQRVLIIYLVNHGVKVPRSLQLLIEYLIQMRLARLEGGYDITKHSRSLNVAYPSIWSLGDMVWQRENSKDYLSTHKSNKIAIIQFYFFFLQTPLYYWISSPSTIRYREYYYIFLGTVTVPLKIRHFPPKYSIEVNCVPRLSHSKDIISC